jgi:hypothetical protein
LRLVSGQLLTRSIADDFWQLVQVASGMAYLHSCQPAVIHGDLKGVR